MLLKVTYSKDIKSLFEEIDVSDTDYEKAINRYSSISEYLAKSELEKYNPKVFVQGSFKLGTPIKPLVEDGAYDIDIVVELTELSKNDITQKQLKKLVGEELLNYAKSNNMASFPENGKRCWTIKYVDGHNFHIDVLPSIPNLSKDNNEIAFTDKRNLEYDRITEKWNISNPQDYFKWFLNLSKHSEYKKRYALYNKLDVERIPDYKIKTPLQRVVQILKRHAELMFSDDLEYKPSSIIITTLTAKAYSHVQNGDYSFNQLIKIIVNNLENELDFQMGNYMVLNPVDKRENLSVKWNNIIYYNHFKRWVNQLKFDFSADETKYNSNEEFNLMKRSLLNRKPETRQLQSIIDSIPYHKKMIWENQIWKDVHLKCFLVKEKRKVRELKSGEKISKNVSLRFEAYSDNINFYKIYWQITNTGFEAQQYGQLRGDFYDSELIEGNQVRNERTAYFGKHYVEAFLVNEQNQCVGRSYPFVVNIE